MKKTSPITATITKSSTGKEILITFIPGGERALAGWPALSDVDVSQRGLASTVFRVVQEDAQAMGTPFLLENFPTCLNSMAAQDGIRRDSNRMGNLL